MSNQSTKNKIKTAFQELTVQSSLSKVKVADIIAKAGISRMTFYRHYLDKYDLVEKICFDDFSLFEKHYGNNATWKQVVMSILNVVYSYGEFYQKVLEDEEGQQRFFEAQRNISKRYTGEFADRAMNVAWTGTLVRWAENGFQETPEEIYQNLVFNLPVREVLSNQKLDQAIKKYESKTMEEFMTQEKKESQT